MKCTETLHIFYISVVEAVTSEPETPRNLMYRWRKLALCCAALLWSPPDYKKEECCTS